MAKLIIPKKKNIKLDQSLSLRIGQKLHDKLMNAAKIYNMKSRNNMILHCIEYALNNYQIDDNNDKEVTFDYSDAIDVSLKYDIETKNKIEKISKETGQSKNYIVNAFIMHALNEYYNKKK